MSGEICQCMKKRDQYKVNNDFINYKLAHKKCVTMIREAKQIYYRTCIGKSKGGSSKLWKHLNHLAPTDPKSTPTCLKENNVNLTRSTDIGECLNDYFSTVVQHYISVTNSVPSLNKFKEFIDSKLPTTAQLIIPPVSQEYVFESLSKLDPHKSTGLSGVSSKILNFSATVIVSPLTSIFDRSIITGVFPSQWKKARITPVFKSGSHSDKNNYRSISVYKSICCK